MAIGLGALMVTTICCLLLCFSPDTPALLSEFPAALQQWLDTRFSWPNGLDFAGADTTEPDANTAVTSKTDDEATAADSDEGESTDTLAQSAMTEEEPLEAIEESRPDELDEFAEANNRREGTIDVEELTESTSVGVLTEAGEVDWTSQAD